MAVPKFERKPPRAARPRDTDLVPNEASESYRFIERVAREGKTVSTEGLSDAEIRALLAGPRKET